MVAFRSWSGVIERSVSTGKEHRRKEFRSFFGTDCNDASDETNPFQPCVYPQCPEGQFTCSNFRCIDDFKRCNGTYLKLIFPPPKTVSPRSVGYNDCNDGNATDEIGCPSRVCNGTNSMKCPNNNICIQRSYLCGRDVTVSPLMWMFNLLSFLLRRW